MGHLGIQQETPKKVTLLYNSMMIIFFVFILVQFIVGFPIPHVMIKIVKVMIFVLNRVNIGKLKD